MIEAANIVNSVLSIHWNDSTATTDDLICLHDQLCKAEERDDVHVALIIARSNFCISLAPDEMAGSADPAGITARLHAPWAGEATPARLWREVFARPLTLPLVFSVEGDCFDAGLAYMALHADVRVAGAGARFGFPGLADGSAAGFPLVSRLDEQINATALWSMITLGDPVHAARAQAIGLVALCAAAGGSEDRARAEAAIIAKRRSARVVKAALDAGRMVDR